MRSAGDGARDLARLQGAASVGLSIGATRLFSQFFELGALDAAAAAVAQVCVLRVEPGLGAAYAALATELRAAGLNVEVYGGDDKLGKQLKYAVRGKVPLTACPWDAAGRHRRRPRRALDRRRR